MTNPVNNGSGGGIPLDANNRTENDSASIHSDSSMRSGSSVPSNLDIESATVVSEATPVSIMGRIARVRNVLNRVTVFLGVHAVAGLTTAIASGIAHDLSEDPNTRGALYNLSTVASIWSVIATLSTYAAVGYQICRENVVDNESSARQRELLENQQRLSEQESLPPEQPAVERNTQLPEPSGVGGDSDSDDGFDFDFYAYAKGVSGAMDDSAGGAVNQGFEPDPQPGSSGISFVQVHSGRGGHINPAFECESSDDEDPQDGTSIIQIPLRRSSRRIIFTKGDDPSSSSSSSLVYESDSRSEEEGDEDRDDSNV